MCLNVKDDGDGCKAPKVSVIVPVYHVEAYLRNCLDSIIDQSLDAIEIICIDDGSADSCPAILDAYAGKDKRIKAVHKANTGYGHSVNIGLEIAEGEYIGIVESDDYILPEMYETLYRCAASYNLDAVRAEYFKVWRDGDIRIRKREKNIPYNQVLGVSDRSLLFGSSIANWSGIYKKDFLKKHGIRHHETPGAAHQDIGFWIQIMSMAERIMWVDQAFYMYRQDNPSQSIKNRSGMMSIRAEYGFAEKILTERGLYRELDYMNAFRLSMYKFAFYNRIGEELKASFAELAIQDFIKYRYFTYAEDAVITQSVLKWYEKLAEKREAVCLDAAGKMRFLDTTGRMILCGTGETAGSIYMRLCEKGLIDRLRYVAVTKKDCNHRFMFHEVREMGELSEYRGDLMIVTSKKGTEEYVDMIAALDTQGFRNHIGYQDMEKILLDDYRESGEDNG